MIELILLMTPVAITVAGASAVLLHARQYRRDVAAAKEQLRAEQQALAAATEREIRASEELALVAVAEAQIRADLASRPDSTSVNEKPEHNLHLAYDELERAIRIAAAETDRRGEAGNRRAIADLVLASSAAQKFSRPLFRLALYRLERRGVGIVKESAQVIRRVLEATADQSKL